MLLLRIVSIGGWVLYMAQSSSLAPRQKIPPQYERLSNREDTPECIEDENNDFFKAKTDWWKDPFACFPDSEQELGDMKTKKMPSSQKSGKIDQAVLASTKNPSSLSKLLSKKKKRELVEPESLVEKSNCDRSTTGTSLNKKKIFQNQRELPKKNRKVQESAVAMKLGGFFPISSGSSSTSRTLSLKIPPQSTISRTSSKTSSAGIVAAPLALLLTTLSKVEALKSFFPVFKILFLFGFARAAQPIFQRGILQKFSHSNNEEHQEKHCGNYSNTGRDSHTYEQEDSIMINGARRRKVRRHKTKRPPKESPQLRIWSLEWFTRMVSPSPSKNTLPPAKELMKELEIVRKELNIIKSEKESMEREYENASLSLQETQNEIINLQASSQYLKAQVRDSQEVMEKAIRVERRKARIQLAKMKEAMIQIMHRDRKALRRKLKAQEKKQQVANSGSTLL